MPRVYYVYIFIFAYMCVRLTFYDMQIPACLLGLFLLSLSSSPFHFSYNSILIAIVYFLLLFDDVINQCIINGWFHCSYLMWWTFLCIDLYEPCTIFLKVTILNQMNPEFSIILVEMSNLPLRNDPYIYSLTSTIESVFSYNLSGSLIAEPPNFYQSDL